MSFFSLMRSMMWDAILNLRVLDTFLRNWVNLFSHSYNAKLLWKERTVKSICSHSNTRWWSKWELLKQVSDYFGDVPPFLQGNENLSPLIRQYLLEIINDPQDLQDLHLELGVLGRCFISSWRRWATDIHLLWAFISCLACCYSRSLSMYLGDAALQNRLITQAKDCVQPGLNFLQKKFNVQFLKNVPAFKAARLCCPVQVSALRPDARSLEELKKLSICGWCHHS